MRKIKLFFTWFVVAFSRFTSKLDVEDHTDNKCPSCGEVINEKNGFIMLISEKEDKMNGFTICSKCLSKPQELDTPKIISNLRMNFPFTIEELTLSGIAIEKFKSDFLWDEPQLLKNLP